MNLLREYIREILVEQNVLAQGMCFPFAQQKAEEWFEQHYTPPLDPDDDGEKHPDLNDKSKFKIIHGTVTDKWKNPPQPIVHAWVEMGNLVFDDQTQHTKPNGVEKEFYYDMYQPEPYREFTASEAITNCIMKGGEGPWDDDLYAMMQDRDAWLTEQSKLSPSACNEHSLGFIDEEGNFIDIQADGDSFHIDYLLKHFPEEIEAAQSLDEYFGAPIGWIKVSSSSEISAENLSDVTTNHVRGLINMWHQCKDYSTWIKDPDNSSLYFYVFNGGDYLELTIPQFIERFDQSGQLMDYFFEGLLK